MPLRRVAAWSRIYVPNSEHRVAFIAYELSRIGHRRSRRPYQRTRTTTSRNRLGTVIYRQRFISKENSRALFSRARFLCSSRRRTSVRPRRSGRDVDQSALEMVARTPSAYQGRRTMPLGMVEKSPDFIQTRGSDAPKADAKVPRSTHSRHSSARGLPRFTCRLAIWSLVIPATQGFRRQLAEAFFIRPGKFAEMPESPLESCGGDGGRPVGRGEQRLPNSVQRKRPVTTVLPSLR